MRREYIDKRLEEIEKRWQESGLTQAQCCAKHGLSMAVFKTHLYKYRRRMREKAGEKERTHTYIYDGFERLIEENVTFHTDVWLGDNLVRQAGEKVTRLMVNRDTLGLERLVIMEKSSNPVDMRNTKDNGFQNLWVHTDAQGSVVALTLPELTVTDEGLAQGDDFKDNVNAYVLGPFGVLDAAEVHTLHNEDAVYTGKLYDHEANLL